MVIRSTGASLPVLNPLTSTSSPAALSTPLSGGTGYSMADTFEAASPLASSYGGTSYANTGYSSAGAGAGYANPAVPADPTAGTTTGLGECAAENAPGGAVNLANVSGDPRLLQAMQEIAQDPAGAKLVQAAQAPGLRLQIGELPPGVMGLTQGSTITISPQAASNKPDLIHTLSHELGHAATPGDGDSLAEEMAVDQLGQQIQQRIAPGQTFQLDIGGYRGLQQDNGIRNSLAQLGL